MTEYSIVLLVCLAIIAALAILIYVSSRGKLSACEVRRTLDQILANTRNIETTLEQHRKVLYDAHKQIHGVTKALPKATS